MFTLNDIITSAQGGEAINNLAAQFGLTPQQAQDAVNALLPGLSQGLQGQLSSGGLGGLIGALTHGAHQASYEDPTAAAAPQAQEAGGAVLGQIFGSQHAADQIAQHAAQHAGLDPALVQQMMPVIISMIMGGLAKAMQNQGLGGMLGQLAQAAQQGGLGDILGRMEQGATQAQAGGAGGGILGTVLGGLLGGARGTPTGGAPASPGGDAVQAGIDMLQKMLHPGVPATPQQSQGLNDILGQMMRGQR